MTTDPRDGIPHRREELLRCARTRQAAGQLATAELLERRADRTTSPVLASLLRERAGRRRSLGERLLADPSGGGRARGEAVPARRR
ncbi:hypothetical protein E9549_06340 [Blastococcus sp. MG754426]|uniref:hypothetical protein n=1 Tax=unclassified Blastococcus TaxID=2619396 RepID=UPI001EF060C8|nr:MULTISPECIES: hypothetical protein [unclassified Blastococcus]MCF6507023.1 hypothetical protein [Blastococcus sp. MG754426]MCF6511688.1 hypothetical protein [Blastococcus sp. MG754427]